MTHEPTHETTYYAVSRNTAGYMPEADALGPFFTFADAKSAAIDEMRSIADSIDPGAPDPRGESYAEDLCRAAEELNLSNGPTWGDYVNGAGEHELPEWWEIATMTRDDAADLARHNGAIEYDETACDLLGHDVDDETTWAPYSDAAYHACRDCDERIATEGREVPDVVGSYALRFLVDDAESLCERCATDADNPTHVGGDADGWRIDAVEIADDDSCERCAHCDAPIGWDGDRCDEIGHDFGPFTMPRLGGGAVRYCQRPGCRVVSLDSDDDDSDAVHVVDLSGPDSSGGRLSSAVYLVDGADTSYGPGGWRVGRRGDGAPFLVGLCAVIAANPIPDDDERVSIAVGDLVDVDGTTYRVDLRSQWQRSPILVEFA